MVTTVTNTSSQFIISKNCDPQPPSTCLDAGVGPGCQYTGQVTIGPSTFDKAVGARTSPSIFPEGYISKDGLINLTDLPNTVPQYSISNAGNSLFSFDDFSFLTAQTDGGKAGCLQAVQQSCDDNIRKCLNNCLKAYEGGVGRIYDVSDTPSPFDCPTGDMTQTTADWFACRSNCRYQFQDACRVQQCYCQRARCGGDTGTGGAGTGGTGTDPNGNTNPAKTNSTQDQKINITNSAYGVPIELFMVRQFFPGNVLWVSTPRSVTTTTTTQQLNATTGLMESITNTRIDTFVSLFVGIAMGPGIVGRVWIDGVLAYDPINGAALTSQSSLQVSSTLGDENCTLFADMVAQEGAELTPAYRGIAGLFLKDLNVAAVAPTGQGLTGIPTLKIEVIQSIAAAPQTVSGPTISLPNDGLFFVDTESERIFAGDGTNIHIFNYDTLAELRSIAVANQDTVAVAPSNALIGQASAGVEQVVDPVFADQMGTYSIATYAGQPRGSFAVYRHVDQTGFGFSVLAVSKSSGDLQFYGFDDQTGTIGLRIWSYSAALSGGVAHAFVTQQRTFVDATTSLTYGEDSLYVIRAPGTGTAFQILEYPMNSGNGAIVNASYTLANGLFGGSTAITLLGVYPDDKDHTLVLFTTYGGTYRVVKWNPSTNTVVWNVTVPSLPAGGMRARRGSYSNYRYVAVDGNIYVLALSNGAVTLVGAASPAPSVTYKGQFFDGDQDSVLYYSGTLLTRTRHSLISAVANSVGGAVRLIADLANMQGSDFTSSGLDSITMTGYRSGTLSTAAQIVQELSEVYPFNRYAWDRLYFRHKGTSSFVAVDSKWLTTPFGYDKKADAELHGSALVTYDDNGHNGLPMTQAFSLPDVVGNSTVLQINSQYNVLESSTYMRQLAELLVFGAQENDAQANISLPPRYLAITPADSVQVDSGIIYRVSDHDLGSDLSAQYKLELDNADKYNALVSLVGVVSATADNAQAVIGADTPLSYPLIFEHREIAPASSAPRTVLGFGASSWTGEFSGQSSIVPNEYSNTIGATFVATGAMGWGRVTSTPATPMSIFTAQSTESLAIKFYDGLLAAALPATSVSAFSDLINAPLRNLLLVGAELIQYETASLGGDGHTVTFTGLLRARFCTDDAMDHTVGELAYVYDPNAVGQSFAVSSALVKMAGTDGSRLRRHDMLLTDRFNAAPIPVNCLRHDMTAVNHPSALHPSNPYVILYWDQRLPSRDGFTDGDAGSNDVATVNRLLGSRTYLVYLLNDVYDATHFHNLRFITGDTSYIMVRGTTTGISPEPDTITGLGVYALVPTFIWTPLQQDLVNWNAATTRLTAVIIDASDGYLNESGRLIRSWTPSSSYVSGFHQGTM